MGDSPVLLGRRRLLALALAFSLAPPSAAGHAAARPDRRPSRRTEYEVEIAALHAALRLRLVGEVDERVDRVEGRYAVSHAGEGAGLSSRGETTGVLRKGRWFPLRTQSRVQVAGREGHVEVAYDYEGGVVRYRSRSETFFSRRWRLVDDTLALPPDVHVDDTVSALLNFAHGQWLPGPSGTLDTRMVRRRRERGENLTRAPGQFRAEIAPVSLRLLGDQPSGRQIALVDLTGFASWAQRDQPARIVLGADGRPEVVTSRLMYGTTLTIRFLPA
jgi:hypothetical protein